jgi:hypothetical protein
MEALLVALVLDAWWCGPTTLAKLWTAPPQGGLSTPETTVTKSEPEKEA